MKILIVDDDVVSRMVLMHLIESGASGPCEVLEAEDGEDAWRQLEAGAAPGMLFCDLRMPRLSGMELLARVKADARFCALPFVLASAAGDAETMEQALALGADGYIVKPFDAGKVGAQLAQLRARGEDAAATARRLGIGVERLLIYLGGLQRQLDGAGEDIGVLLAAGQAQAARATLDRLREGCLTLGLQDAAAAMDALLLQPGLDGAGVARALAQAHAAVSRRAEAARGPSP